LRAQLARFSRANEATVAADKVSECLDRILPGEVSALRCRFSLVFAEKVGDEVSVSLCLIGELIPSIYRLGDQGLSARGMVIRYQFLNRFLDNMDFLHVRAEMPSTKQIMIMDRGISNPTRGLPAPTDCTEAQPEEA
jgi:hypothetical protein